MDTAERLCRYNKTFVYTLYIVDVDIVERLYVCMRKAMCFIHF